MKSRCKNNTTHAKYYKNRGITIDTSWLIFDNFKNDMYNSYLQHVKDYGEKETSLDRIDPNKNYEKDNCRWVTLKEQVNNLRPKFWISDFKKMTLFIDKLNKKLKTNIELSEEVFIEISDEIRYEK